MLKSITILQLLPEHKTLGEKKKETSTHRLETQNIKEAKRVEIRYRDENQLKKTLFYMFYTRNIANT